MLRSKGHCWLASRPDVACTWSQAGPNLEIRPVARWADVRGVEPGQELVLIGVGLDHAAIREGLRAALA